MGACGLAENREGQAPILVAPLRPLGLGEVDAFMWMSAGFLLQASALSPRSSDPYRIVTTVHLTSLQAQAAVGEPGTENGECFVFFIPPSPSLIYHSQQGEGRPCLVVCSVKVL